MMPNSLATVLRSVRRQPAYGAINIVGLAVGLACGFLIFLWVLDEATFDRFHADGDRIHVVHRNFETSGRIYTWQSVPMKLAEVLESRFPEISTS